MTLHLFPTGKKIENIPQSVELVIHQPHEVTVYQNGHDGLVLRQQWEGGFSTVVIDAEYIRSFLDGTIDLVQEHLDGVS